MASPIPDRRDEDARDRLVQDLYETHAPALFSFLVYRTGDWADAEDILADTFERVLRPGRGVRPRRGSEKAWLYRIALNVLRDQARRRKVEERALAAVAYSDAGAHDGEGVETVSERDAVMRALAALTEEEREAIALRFGADLTVPEIAKVTRQPLSRMEGRVYRALRKLRRLLPPEDEL